MQYAGHNLREMVLLAFESFETIATVQASMHKNHHSNVTAVVLQLYAGNSVAMNHAASSQDCSTLTTQLGQSLRELLAGF